MLAVTVDRPVGEVLREVAAAPPGSPMSSTRSPATGSGEDDVSRETTPVLFAPPAPDVAADVFGPNLERAVAYADLLADAGVVRGLIGPREVPRLWERHVLNAAALAWAFPPADDARPERPLTVADIGSGAGLPGIPLALARPDLQITLVEPLLRRSTFLSEAITALDLGDQVEVVRARADALHSQRTFDVVTARAVAPLPRLLEWTLPLLEVGGQLVALKGESAERELAEAATEMRVRGVADAAVVLVGIPGAQATVIRVVAGRASAPVGRSGKGSPSSTSTPGAGRRRRAAR
jgi:16S rRNA (guanine527-N7)-methyltransferase